MPQPILYETHSHTPLCRHATGEPEELAEEALRRNFKGLIITCHNPLPDNIAQPWRMYPHDWPEYLRIVERARQKYAGRLDIRLGLEADFWPGLEPFLREQLVSAHFHHVLGSVHCTLPDYKERFWSDDPLTFQRTYFEHLALAAESGLFDTISHPDLVKNMMPRDWDWERIAPDVRRALDRIAAAGTAMELNTSGRFKTVPETNPGPPMLREMAARNIPVVVGADVHVPERVGEGYELAFDLLEEAGYDKISFFLDRRRHDVSIAEARASLTPG